MICPGDLVKIVPRVHKDRRSVYQHREFGDTGVADKIVVGEVACVVAVDPQSQIGVCVVTVRGYVGWVFYGGIERV